MNYPTFNEDGDISMVEVITAQIKDFIPEVGRDFALKELSDFLDFVKSSFIFCGDYHYLSKGYDNLFSDYIHEKLNKYETVNGKMRTPNFTLPPEFCFWYNVYSNILGTHPFHHCSEKDDNRHHIKILGKMIDNVANI